MREGKGQTLTISGQPGWPPDHRHSPWPVSPHTVPGSPSFQDCTWKGIMMGEWPGMALHAFHAGGQAGGLQA